ncbi:MAG TPA: MOSC domain-containing protein, partial [Aliidongia sp.]|uniref:MOSC domain-containing protein n=1 Tax=Aliidongia sp. TaxID=1914230 RepID=UPI002DDDB11D
MSVAVPSLISLNLGLPRPLRAGDREVPSGIRKAPVTGPVLIGRDGCAGDGQADLVNHAGPDKAVCVYACEHLPYWSERLGTPLAPGAFGENFSVAGLVERDMHIGDTLEVGAARFQVTQPRGPCFKLGMLHGEPHLSRWVQETGFTGFYLRCLVPGTVGIGDPIRLLEREESNPTVSEVVRVTFHDPDDHAAIDRVVACPPLADAWRGILQR